MRLMMATMVCVMAAGLAFAADEKKALADSDRKFLEQAASSGLMEVAAGRLASENAAKEDVKAFGAQMVKDHTKANDELMALAKKKNVELPPEMTAEHKTHLDTLQKAKGEQLDRAYMTMMLTAHQKDIEAFQMTADRSDDLEVKAFASKTLPVLKAHLELAKKTAKQVGVNVVEGGGEGHGHDR